MKQDLATSIFTAIVGAIIAYFVCNMILPEIQSFSYKTLGSELTYDIKNPNPEIFNYRAVNPTVEVYVGQCESYDQNGNCIVSKEETIDPNQADEIPEEEESTDNQNQNQNNSSEKEPTSESDKNQNSTNGGNNNGATN